MDITTDATLNEVLRAAAYPLDELVPDYDQLFRAVGDAVKVFIGFSDKGAQFVFGNLADARPPDADGTWSRLFPTGYLFQFAFIALPVTAGLEALGQKFAIVDTSPLNPSITISPDIGAANGLEFVGQHRILAAAEPVRRGGGDAAVVHPHS